MVGAAALCQHTSISSTDLLNSRQQGQGQEEGEGWVG